MIIQGSNLPITISFDEDMSNIKDWSMSLFGENKRGEADILLKHWGIEDVDIDGETISAPLTESETLGFIPGVAVLEIKWLSDEDTIYQSETYRIRICGRQDKTLLTSD